MPNPSFGRGTPWLLRSLCAKCGDEIERQRKGDGFTVWTHVKSGSRWCYPDGSGGSEPTAEQLTFKE